MNKRFTTLLLLLTLISCCVCAEQENLITISANGARTTYAFDSFRSATLEDKSAEILAFNVNFNDGTKGVGNVRSIIREVTDEEPQEEVEIETGETSATFTWPPVDEAVTYQLIIYKDYTTGERYCTLTFNSNGQLINIDFNSAGPTTKAAQDIFSFTVTGLDKNREYHYVMQALGSVEEVLEENIGSFETGDMTTSTTDIPASSTIYSRNKTIVVDCSVECDIIFYDTLGRQVGDCIKTKHCEAEVTLSGIYIVLVDGKQHKIRID